MSEQLERTPLYDRHVAADAKIVPFAGFEMPVQYPTGITAEHRAVREGAGLFDVSHMGEFVVRGPQALELVQHVSVNDAAKMEVGQAQYSAMCLEDGGIIDDLLIYRFRGHYMLVVNASNLAKDWAWIERQSEAFECELEHTVVGPDAKRERSRLSQSIIGAHSRVHDTVGALLVTDHSVVDGGA